MSETMVLFHKLRIKIFSTGSSLWKGTSFHFICILNSHDEPSSDGKLLLDVWRIHFA